MCLVCQFARTAYPLARFPVQRRLSLRSAVRYKVAILADRAAVKHIGFLVIAATLFDFSVAHAVPLPRPRPAQAPTVPRAQAPAVPPAEKAEPAEPDAPPPLSACRLRLTTELAIAPSLPPLTGPGGCGGEDIVRLEAVVLADKHRVALIPPATVRCTFAEAIVQWVREDVAAAVRSLKATLKSIDNFDSYECRGRNRVSGAKLSEHGRANALDIRSLLLGNGTRIELTDPQASKDFREALRKSTCVRFSTVLGPGSDGYHENHIHVDLAERRSGYRMCQWAVRDPANVAPPLPRERPPEAQPPTTGLLRQAR